MHIGGNLCELPVGATMRGTMDGSTICISVQDYPAIESFPITVVACISGPTTPPLRIQLPSAWRIVPRQQPESVVNAVRGHNADVVLLYLEHVTEDIGVRLTGRLRLEFPDVKIVGIAPFNVPPVTLRAVARMARAGMNALLPPLYEILARSIDSLVCRPSSGLLPEPLATAIDRVPVILIRQFCLQALQPKGHTWTVAGLARDLAVSEADVTRAFALYGLASPQQFVVLARLYQALAAHGHSHLTSEEIAASFGWPHGEAFRKALRRHAHLSLRQAFKPGGHDVLLERLLDALQQRE